MTSHRPIDDLRRRAYTLALVTFRRLPPWLRRTLVRAGTPHFTVGAVCAIEHAGELLVLRQPHRPGWSLPGGLLDRGESAAEGVVRELREETGLHIEVGLPLSVLVNGPLRRVDVVFRIRADARPHAEPGGEATEVAWLPLARIPDDADGPTREIVDLLRRVDEPGAAGGRVVATP